MTSVTTCPNNERDELGCVHQRLLVPRTGNHLEQQPHIRNMLIPWNQVADCKSLYPVDTQSALRTASGKFVPVRSSSQLLSALRSICILFNIFREHYFNISIQVYSYLISCLYEGVYVFIS